jgi:AcrR family transcriptional regulator
MESAPTKDLQVQILSTARHLLATDGYTQLSMRKIARSIGCSATAIYLYYRNRDDLVHALIDHGVDLLYERMTRAQLTSESSPREMLRSLCRAYIEFGLKYPEYYEIMYILHPEYSTRYPKEKYRKARRNLRLFGDALLGGTKSGVFNVSDHMLAASIVWSKLHGIVSLVNSRRMDARLDIETVVDEAIDRVVAAYTFLPANVA